MSPRRADAPVALAAAAVGVIGSVADSHLVLTSLSAALVGAALGLWRSRPWAAGLVAVAGVCVCVPLHALSWTVGLLVFANAYAAGRYGGRTTGALVAAGLLAAVQAQAAVAHEDAAVPAVFLVATAWIAGAGIRRRDEDARRLAERAEELDREREAYAALSVRYERARIASELHDIVAHAISVMVVQAGAGQRLAAIEPGLTQETFGVIADAARQAKDDMGRLVALLADERETGAAPDLALVEELVARAASTGLDVTLRLEGPREGLPGAAVQAVYRVVREALTNALRYASGSAVEVLVRGEHDALVVEVVNEAGPAAARLAGQGTGNGLRGLRETVDALGGRLDAGPWGHDGWRVAARIPRRVAAPAG